MSVPPPPDPWGSQPPTAGRPGGVPPWGPPPQMPAGQPGGVPPWGAQQPWSAPPGPLPRGGRGKWILAGIAALVVIAVTAVITVLVVRPDSEDNSPTPRGNGSESEFASADDKGSVGIIAEDPTCEAWGRVAREYSAQAQAVNWSGRDQSVPASAWTPEQRTTYETVGKGMTSAADQTVNLVKLTPHRVMRELYEQFIAYARAFTDRIPTYTANDGYLAGTTDAITSGLAAICSAIDYRSAPTIAPLIPEAAPPSVISTPGNPDNPQRFLTIADPLCSEWSSELTKFSADTAAWRAIDPKISSSQWSPDQKAINDAVAPVMAAHADDLERLGRRSNSPTLQDFAILSAQYFRAYVKALPTYTATDNYLSESATYLAVTINAACKAAGG